MRILVAYRDIPHLRGMAAGASMVRALRFHGHDAQPYAKVYQRDAWLLPPWPVHKAELLIYMECGDSDPQYMELSPLSCPKAYWEFDTAIHEPESNAFMWEFGFDTVFFGNRRKAETHEVFYLPYGFDPDLMSPTPGERVKSGAGIIGTEFPERRKFADAAGLELRSGILGQSYIDAVAGLLVHVHHFDSGGDGLIVCRPWETMGLGTCLLTPRTPEMEELFKDGMHCVMYDSDEEARLKVKVLLDKPDMAKKIGEQGRAAVLARHTYLHRAAWLLPRAMMVHPL